MKNKLLHKNSKEAILKTSFRFTEDFLKAAGFIECEFEDQWGFAKKFKNNLKPNTFWLKYSYEYYDQLEECL